MKEETAQALLAEVRGLRADLRRQSRTDDSRALVAAIESELGRGAFTAAGLIDIGHEDADGVMAAALDQAANWRNAGGAISLGRALARMPEIAAVGDQRGALVFRMRG